MYCAKCGSQLVTSANFCHVCGAKSGNAQTPTPVPLNPTYEVCTITFDLIKVAGFFSFAHTWQWIAEANGPKGKYSAAVSQEFKAGARNDDILDGPNLHYGEAKQALDQLIATLLLDRWEPVASSAFHPKFRRRINESLLK
jgi:hypothetical protein